MDVFPIINSRTKIFICSFFFLFLLFVIILLVREFLTNRDPLSHRKCVGIIELHHNNTSANMHVVFNFYEKKHASLVLSGSANEPGKAKMNIYRKFDFSYLSQRDGSIVVEEARTVKYSGDNINDDYFSQKIFPFPEKGSEITLRKFKNTYVIYNHYAPFLVCEKKESH